MSRKTRYRGVTVNPYLDGTSGEFDLILSCDAYDHEAQRACPFAQGMIMEDGKLADGVECCYRESGQCRLPAARLAGLQKVKSLVADAVKELESEGAQ